MVFCSSMKFNLRRPNQKKTLSKKQINYIAISLGLITEKKKYALNIE